jgi:hypothetical protein
MLTRRLPDGSIVEVRPTHCPSGHPLKPPKVQVSGDVVTRTYLCRVCGLEMQIRHETEPSSSPHVSRRGWSVISAAPRCWRCSIDGNLVAHYDALPVILPSEWAFLPAGAVVSAAAGAVDVATEVARSAVQ